MKLIKNVSFVACLMLFPLMSSVGEEQSHVGKIQLTIEVVGLEKAQGSIYIAVYDSGDTWLGEQTVEEHQVEIARSLKDTLLTTQLYLPPGDYALSIFYDSNDNGELDTNFIGIPKEPIALSNNALSKYGPPKYKDAVFTLGAVPVVQHIVMADI